MADPDPARLAAIDQQLAELSDRMGKHDRAIMNGDLSLMLLAAVAIIYTLIARPVPSWWNYLALWVLVAGLAAGGFVQGLRLRSYRAEIRDLRSRVPRT